MQVGFFRFNLFFNLKFGIEKSIIMPVCRVPALYITIYNILETRKSILCKACFKLANNRRDGYIRRKN